MSECRHKHPSELNNGCTWCAYDDGKVAAAIAEHARCVKLLTHPPEEIWSRGIANWLAERGPKVNA